MECKFISKVPFGEKKNKKKVYKVQTEEFSPPSEHWPWRSDTLFVFVGKILQDYSFVKLSNIRKITTSLSV